MTGRILAIVAYMATAYLAACLEGPETVQDDPLIPPEGGELHFNERTEIFGMCPLIDCGSYASFEPNIALGQGGMLAASATGALARSIDGGRSFVRIAIPSLEVSRIQDGWLPQDAFVQTDPLGRIWLTMMEVHDPFGSGTVEGFRIYRTVDAGLTWDLEVAVRPGWSARNDPDRQWLAFGDGQILLSFQGLDARPGGFAMVSEDDGQTWEGPFQTSPRAEHGMPVWSNGRFIIPFAHASALSVGAWVAVSADGKEWKSHEVSPRWTPDYWPTLATDERGVLSFAWRHMSESNQDLVLLAESQDGGSTWSRPIQVSHPGETVWAAPWAISSQGKTWIAYYSSEDGSPLTTLNVVQIAEGTASRGIVATGINQRAATGFTDFAHGIFVDNRPYFTYPDGQGSAYVTSSQ